MGPMSYSRHYNKKPYDWPSSKTWSQIELLSPTVLRVVYQWPPGFLLIRALFQLVSVCALLSVLNVTVSVR